MALLVALPVLVHCKGETPDRSSSRTREVVCKADDGVATRGILYATDVARPPGIVLVPAFGSSPETWGLFAQRAQEEGFMCLALAMRESTTGKEGVVFDQAAARNALKDIEAAMRCLREQGADPDNLAVAGASVGANLALHYAVAHHDVQAAVLVSPGLDLKGVKTEGAIAELGKRPVLLVTTKGDAYAASSCATLKRAASGFCEFREYEGSAHGTDIFASSPNSVEQILQWLEGILVGQNRA